MYLFIYYYKKICWYIFLHDSRLHIMIMVMYMYMFTFIMIPHGIYISLLCEKKSAFEMPPHHLYFYTISPIHSKPKPWFEDTHFHQLSNIKSIISVIPKCILYYSLFRNIQLAKTNTRYPSSYMCMRRRIIQHKSWTTVPHSRGIRITRRATAFMFAQWHSVQSVDSRQDKKRQDKTRQGERNQKNVFLFVVTGIYLFIYIYSNQCAN